MAIKLIHSIQSWIGLSSDTKPSDPPVGSTFHETDTGETFVYDDDIWTEDLRLIHAVEEGTA